MKQAVSFTTHVMEKASVLNPSRYEYFVAHGMTIMQKMLIAIGKDNDLYM